MKQLQTLKFAPLILALLGGTAAPLGAQFTPGSGGTVPDIAPFTDPVDSIGGLTVYQTHRQNYVFVGGNHAEIDLEFFPPIEFGADAYVLQRSLDGTSGWVDVPGDLGVLRTQSSDQDNFSIDPDGQFHFRLRVEGGPRNGQFSNVVHVPVSLVETRFAGWSVDSSMFLTGTSYPWVGHGMEASFTVKKLLDDSVVPDAVDLQWFRVNPRTSEMTAIPGATNPLYVTTNDDVGGWLLFCRATGDEVDAGGFIQIQAGGGVKIPNKAFVNQFTSAGFRLNLHKSVPSLDPADLKLTYFDDELFMNVDVPVDSVTPVGGNASFQIGVTIPAGVTQLSLSNESDVWALGEEVSHHPGIPPMFLEFLDIDIEPEITVMQPAGKVLVDNRGTLNFGAVKVKKRSAPKVFTIRNDGGANLSSISVRATGGGAKHYIVTNPPIRTLTPGASTTFRVTLAPRAKGTAKAKLQVRSNDRDENPFDVNLTGRGK